MTICININLLVAKLFDLDFLKDNLEAYVGNSVNNNYLPSLESVNLADDENDIILRSPSHFTSHVKLR